MGLSCSSEEELEPLVRKNPSVLSEFYQTEDVCIRAVSANPKCIKYVRDMTPEIFKASLQTDAFVTMKCAKLTYELVDIAIDYDGTLIQYIPANSDGEIVRTEEMCLRAVEQNGLALQYIDDQSLIMCLAAVKQNGLALKYCKYKPNYICEKALENNGLALYYIEYQDHSLCTLAIKQNPLAIKYVNDQTLDLCRTAVRAHPNKVSEILKNIRFAGMAERIWQEYIEERNSKILEKVDDEFVECRLEN